VSSLPRAGTAQAPHQVRPPPGDTAPCRPIHGRDLRRKARATLDHGARRPTARTKPCAATSPLPAP